jgi:hypothetical protein
MKRKAQGGLNAAILVAILAGVIIIYILFLPTEDRKALLEEESDYTGGTGGGSSTEELITLISENVGRLDPVGKVRDKELPNVNIFETKNSKVLDTINPIYIRNGWFDKKSKVVKFDIENLENTNDVMLSFSVPKRQGVLSISLNGELIYEYSITSLNANPIKLKSGLLDGSNELEFSVNSVGAKFWTTNEYALESVQIIGDITDTSRQESQNVFSLSDTEYQNMEKAEIRFIPYCLSSTDVGVLDVFVNNRNVFSSVPVCNDRYEQEMPISALSAGQNKVLFKTNKGSYSVEQILLSFSEKDAPEAVYYFEINESTFEDIQDNDYNAFVRVEFVDDEDRKRADINVHDHLTRIDQERKTYERNIDNWVEEGNNFIKITPKTTLEIVELNIELEER